MGSRTKATGNMPQNREYYGTRYIAAAIGQTERTVRSYLRERDPAHEGWWRFTAEEAHAIIRALRCRPDVVPRRRGNLRRHRRKSQALRCHAGPHHTTLHRAAPHRAAP